MGTPFLPTPNSENVGVCTPNRTDFRRSTDAARRRLDETTGEIYCVFLLGVCTSRSRTSRLVDCFLQIAAAAASARFCKQKKNNRETKALEMTGSEDFNFDTFVHFVDFFDIFKAPIFESITEGL